MTEYPNALRGVTINDFRRVFGERGSEMYNGWVQARDLSSPTLPGMGDSASTRRARETVDWYNQLAPRLLGGLPRRLYRWLHRK